jgi:pSer/pThr/pTyr-binding forkhead associated (FHA) protein
MFGARVGGGGRTAAAGRAKKAPKAAKPSRRAVPTHVAIVSGSNSGQTLSLDHAPIVIGRGADAQIVLDDDYVSTRHARIAVSADQWFVEDLGSTNGTYIGTVRIHQPTAISVGTQVRIGKTVLELRK